MGSKSISPEEVGIEGSQKTVVNDPVNHPAHYNSGKYESIDIIEDQLGMKGLRGFCLGNAMKYINRAGKKDPAKELEDLQKAEWYLHHYIERYKAVNVCVCNEKNKG